MNIIEKCTGLAEVVSYLNACGISYTVRHFSPSYADEEIEQEISRLGMGFLETIPLDVQGQGLILAIIPASLALDFAQFCDLLSPSKAQMLAPSDLHQRFQLAGDGNKIPPLGHLFGVQSFLSPLIEKYQMIGFPVGSNAIIITMQASEFRRAVLTSSTIPVPTRRKYRAYASDRKRNDSCILGVSLESREFYTPKLVTITDWIRKEYRRCTVMVGDGLYRITLQLDSNIPEDQALEHSKWIARDFVHSQLSVFALRVSNYEFEFRFCSDIQSADTSYGAYYGQITSLFRDNETFRDSCKSFADAFLQRKPQRQGDHGSNVDMSCRYLLEELSVICCLAERGPCSFVYPGSLTILEEIAQGKHPEVPAPLTNVDYVELKLKRD